MKTQKDIEKEIKTLNKEIKDRDIGNKQFDRFKIINADRKINILRALLQQSKDFVEMIDKCSGIKCGWMDGEICERIDKQELKSSIIGSEEEK